MVSNYFIIGSVERPDIKVVSYQDKKRTEYHLLNRCSWIPIISTVTGTVHAVVSLAHTVYHFVESLGMGEGLEAKAKRHREEATLGAKNILRGCIVALPLIGNIIAIAYDLWQKGHVKGPDDQLTLFTCGEKIHSQQLSKEVQEHLNTQFKNVEFSRLESLAWPKPSCTFKPIQDESGFVIGGKNETDTIRRLTTLNGRAIDRLEGYMNGSIVDGNVTSADGFLGKEEKLLDVLAKDNGCVQNYGLTHSQLAHPLFEILKLTKMSSSGICSYQGQTYKYENSTTKGWQHSPFFDGTEGTTTITLQKPGTNETLEYTNLVAYMILRYGFYEGNTPYRVEPLNIITFFNLNDEMSLGIKT